MKLKKLLQFESILEGVYDPGILKCIFMAGGPGSGKSYIASKLFGFDTPLRSFGSSGLKLVSSDIAFEQHLRKNGIDPKDLAKISKSGDYSNIDTIRATAKAQTKKQKSLYEKGRLGLLIDGTGHKYDKIAKQKRAAEALGYDCYMVFVNTSLDTALERNRQRSRTLPDEIVTQYWEDTQAVLGRYNDLFGKNFRIVDNNEKRPISTAVQKAIDDFIRQPIMNRIGQKWIQISKLLRRKK